MFYLCYSDCLDLDLEFRAETLSYKSLMRMQQRALSQAFWDRADGADAPEAEAADRKRAERAPKLVANRSLRMAFGRWVEYAEQCARPARASGPRRGSHAQCEAGSCFLRMVVLRGSLY